MIRLQVPCVNIALFTADSSASSENGIQIKISQSILYFMFVHNDVILVPTPHPHPGKMGGGGGEEEINEGYIYRDRQTDRQTETATDRQSKLVFYAQPVWLYQGEERNTGRHRDIET